MPKIKRSCLRILAISNVAAPMYDTATKVVITQAVESSIVIAAKKTVAGRIGGAKTASKTGMEPTHGDNVVNRTSERAAVLCTAGVSAEETDTV